MSPTGTPQRVVIVGGGAAGFFAAIACAEANPDASVTILERGPHFLAKVKISGGGRCNVTHACFEPRELATRYPRGERAMIGPLQRFQPRDVIAWFKARGVELKTEPDGRMFPVTDSSQTIIDCFLASAKRAGVHLRLNCGASRILREEGRGFRLELTDGTVMFADRVLLATGGCRGALGAELVTNLGHTMDPPVPSLFTFQIQAPWLHQLAGVALDQAEVSVPACGLREKGPLLITHWGLSGPAILRLSAWGARALHALDYRFPLLVNWLPGNTVDSIAAELQSRRQTQPAKLVVNTPIAPLTARLWESLVLQTNIPRDTRWAALPKSAQHALVQRLSRSEFQVEGKSLNKDEFVTCGGVKLGEVNLKTMESRICPGLFFAGEFLDIDGITGGFNFQAAWTTGWIAGHAMAATA